MQQSAIGKILHIVALGQLKPNFIIRSDGKRGIIAVMPGGDIGWHSDGWMYQRIGLFANAYEQLTNNMSLPGELCRVGDVLPLTATIGEQRVCRLNPLWRGSQNLDQICPHMSSALLYNLNTHPLARNPSRYKQDTSLIAAYGIASVGKIGKFNINAHVHLGGHLTTFHVVDAVTSFQRFCIRQN